MIDILEQPIKVTKKPKEIPKALIYEQINGRNYYYKGYKSILNKPKQWEGIMGDGLLQWILIDIITSQLKTILGNEYYTIGGEGGAHLAHKSNLSFDIAIFLKVQIDFKNLQNKYLDFPPQAVIEVNTKAELTNSETMEYYTLKTQAILDFGVKEVVWVFTNIKKIWVAKPNENWLVINWADDIMVLDTVFNLQKLIDEKGIEVK